MKRKYRIAAGCLGAFLALLCPCGVLAFEPWSRLNGYWISADGRSTIEGAWKKGVTITKYQNKLGEIKWDQLGRDEISFVMVRLGYSDDKDPFFEANMEQAGKTRLDIGVCFYSRAASAEEARKEAAYVLDVVKDYRVTYPISFEVDAQAAQEKKLTRVQVTRLTDAFCSAIEEAGYKVVVFGDSEWLTQRLEMRKLPYDVWYSRYGMAHDYPNRTLWRCTDRASVRGIEGNVCLEFSFVDYRRIFQGTGWREINGQKYYFRNYEMVKNTGIRIGDRLIFFDKDGNEQRASGKVPSAAPEKE